MSQTETITILENYQTSKKKSKSKPSSNGMFATKTNPGQPWPNPPKGTVTLHEDKGRKKDKNKGCCCLTFRGR